MGENRVRILRGQRADRTGSLIYIGRGNGYDRRAGTDHVLCIHSQQLGPGHLKRMALRSLHHHPSSLTKSRPGCT